MQMTLTVNVACAVLAQTRKIGAMGALHLVEALEVVLSKMESARGRYTIEQLAAGVAELGQPLSQNEVIALSAVAAAREGK